MVKDNRRRVVITGLGAVTPLGIGVQQTWEALCQGKSGIAKITKFDASDMKTQIAAELKEFDPADFLDKKKIRRTDPFIHYALAAAIMAVDDAKIAFDNTNADKTGIVVGTSVGGLSTYGRTLESLKEFGSSKISPFFITSFIPNMAIAEIAISYGIRGPSKCVSAACATGTQAIGEAYRLIQYGETDVMIAGGSEAYLIPVGIAGLSRMGAVSSRNDEPEKASRPFDKNRDGFVLGEGAGIIVLEELNYALGRNARIYAEIAGYGTNIDSYHITAPDTENQARCMRLALRDAHMLATELDYINAHGTSTVLNDIAETKAIKSVLGSHSKNIAVSSIKSMTGHLLAAAGAVEAISTALTIENGIIPPTINYETPDPECDLDYVPNVARKADINAALSNSFGFGGANATLILKKYNP